MALPHFSNPFVKKQKDMKNKTRIYTTGKFKKVLKRISSESWIAAVLLKGLVDKDMLIDGHANFINISHSDPTKISYISAKKLDQAVKKISYENGYSGDNLLALSDIPSEHLFKAKGRVKIKFGSFVNKLFKDVDPKDVEKFASLMKAIMLQPNFSFEIVEGEDIRKYYHYQWHASNKGSLGISCMRHDNCTRYFTPYVENSDTIKMLIMFDRDRMVKARALLWTLDEKNGLEEEFKFMDRIYTTNDDQTHHFIDWAKKNGYYYKEKQSWNTPNRFQFGDDLVTKKMKIHLTNSPTKHVRSNGGHGMPYLDTFKWMNVEDGTFYNYKPTEDSNKRSIYTPVSTNGDVYGFNYLKEDTFHKEYWYEGEVKWVDYLKQEISERYMQWSNVNDSYIVKDHTIFEKYVNDYIFNEEYEKFNNRDNINKIIEHKKEKERIRLEKIKKTVMKTIPYFQKYVEAGNAWMDGTSNQIAPNYDGIEEERSNLEQLNSDNIVMGRSNLYANYGDDRATLDNLWDEVPQPTNDQNFGNENVDEPVVVADMPVDAPVDGEGNFTVQEPTINDQLSDLFGGETQGIDLEGILNEYMRRDMNDGIERSYENWVDLLRDRMRGDQDQGDQNDNPNDLNPDSF